MVALMTDKLNDVISNMEIGNMLLSPEKAKNQVPKSVSSPNDIAEWIATYFRCWAGGEKDEAESTPALAKGLKRGKKVTITYKGKDYGATISKKKGDKWVCKDVQGLVNAKGKTLKRVTMSVRNIFEPGKPNVARAPGCFDIKRFANDAPKTKLEEAGIAQALRVLGKHLSKMSSVSPAERTPAAQALLKDLKDETLFPKKWGENDNGESSAGDDGTDDAANDDGNDEVTDDGDDGDGDDGEGGDRVAETKMASDTVTPSSPPSLEVPQFKVSMRNWTCTCSVRRSRSYTTYIFCTILSL
jgi:hypothetical protein